MKKKDDDIRTIEISSEGSILEQFQEFFAKHKKVSDILDFLGVQNARLLAKQASGGLTEEEENEVVEFADYFLDEFDEITYGARMDRWGREPYILRLADEIAYGQWEIIQSAAFSEMTEVHKKEAETLRDTLMAIRQDKVVEFITESDSGSMDIPRSIRKEELEFVRQIVLYRCAEVIRERGLVAVEVVFRDHSEVFGIQVSPIGIWMPMTKEETRAHDCTTPSGIELEPEDDVIYTEIQRERF